MDGAWGTSRRFRWLLGAIVALGLALRIAGAQGGLWIDEAWSAVQARDAGTPMAIFLNINHDNNHHLNSLWMQLVGFGAPPPLARAFSVATATAAIFVAGLIGARRAPLLGLVTAFLFAVSPVMVTLGSEARGYAPMTLALLTVMLLVDRWLAVDAKYSPALSLALCFFLGAFSQLTMFFGFCAVAGWMFFALWKRSSFKQAVLETLGLLLPSIIALALVVAIVLGAAAARTGFKFGSFDPFDGMQFLHGSSEMFQYTLGFPIITAWWFALVPAALVVLAPSAGVARLAFYRLAILAFPAMLVVLQVGNTGHPRYYLLAGIALLLLVAELIWLGWKAGGWKRWLAGGAFAAMTVSGLALDVDLAINRRGDSGAAIRAMQARAPQGTRLILRRETGLATITVAAAAAGYPLEVTLAHCPPARFLFADRFKGQELVPTIERCERRYAPILDVHAHGMSGMHWTLYEQQP